MLEILAPDTTPVYVMAKPVGSACNLACGYCYYLEKGKRQYGSTGHHGAKNEMDELTLEKYIKQYIECSRGDIVEFVWHGGEPTLRGLDFYRLAINLQRRFCGGKQVRNSLQTNGTLLTEEWCRFLRDHKWLVGLSIDGNRMVHDMNRRDRGGRGSFDRVMRGARLLDKCKVEWNAMATVNATNVKDAHGFYNFFKEIGCRYIQFTPVVERKDDSGNLLAGYADGGELTELSVSPHEWGRFLIELFDEWVRCDVGRYFIQLFDATLANWMGMEPGLCSLSSYCGHAAVMEHNGDVYSCDHFVFDDYKLGNIHNNHLAELMKCERQREFSKAKGLRLARQCHECRWKFACHGECPRNRFGVSVDGKERINYLCEGYRMFFNHVAPYMDFMKRELEAGRAPANVMNYKPVNEQ